MLTRMLKAVVQGVCLNMRSSRAWGGPRQMLQAPPSLSPISLKFRKLHSRTSASYLGRGCAGQFRSLKNNFILLVELTITPQPGSKLIGLNQIVSSTRPSLTSRTLQEPFAGNF